MSAHGFDERAATWDDDPAKRQRAQEAAGCIRRRIALTPTTRLLEYGAGTGLVTQALLDSVGPVTLADTSTGMRKVMEEKIAAGLMGDDARIWAIDLATDEVPDDRFDLIVTVMTLHHIPDLEPVLAKFNTLLVEGGHLCIVDLDKEDGSFHGEDFHGHKGFDTAGLSASLAEAGFDDVSVEPCGHMLRDGRTFSLFLATGTARHT